MADEKTRGETHDEVVADMLRRAEYAAGMDEESLVHNSAVAGMLKDFAYRAQAACRREVDAAVLNKDFADSAEYLRRCAAAQKAAPGGGNAAKLREAVEGIEMLLGAGGDLDRKELAEECARALAAPPRNCDVGTAGEQSARYVNSAGMDVACLVCQKIDCCENERIGVMEWLQRPFVAAPGHGGAE